MQYGKKVMFFLSDGKPGKKDHLFKKQFYSFYSQKIHFGHVLCATASLFSLFLLQSQVESKQVVLSQQGLEQ